MMNIRASVPSILLVNLFLIALFTYILKFSSGAGIFGSSVMLLAVLFLAVMFHFILFFDALKFRGSSVFVLLFLTTIAGLAYLWLGLTSGVSVSLFLLLAILVGVSMVVVGLARPVRKAAAAGTASAKRTTARKAVKKKAGKKAKRK